jgi:selenide,water dikinase
MVAFGEVHPDRIVTISGARAGDALVLTKPVGTGVLTTALKQDLLSAQDLAPAVASMTTLNAGAARAMLETGVHAATDVTGFGLIGHLHNMLSASGVAAEIRAAAVPLLPGARGAAERGALPGGSKRNRENLSGWVTFASPVGEIDRALLHDAQTSGGLLIALPEERERAPQAAVIGRVVAGPAGRITVA